MNERIKELEVQCWEERPYGPPWFDSKKFAQLIVRECIRNYRLKHLEYIRTGQYVDEYEHANNMLAQLGFEETFRS
jgi:hypothetical protein